MKQRDMMRELFRRHGDDEERLVTEYATAERQGRVDRSSNEYDVDPEDYARRLLADARKKGWIRGLR